MKIENNLEEGMENNEPLENTGGDLNIEIADTSDPNYQANTYGPGEDNKFDDDFYGGNAGNQEDDDNNDSDPKEQGDGKGGDGQAVETDNIYFNEYAAWAKRKGIEVDQSKYDLEKFDEEAMDMAVGDYYAKKRLDNADPRIKHLVENNLDLNAYMQQQAQLQEQISAAPENVFKANMYAHLYNEAYQQGLLKADEQGRMTEDSQQYLIDQVEARAKRLGEQGIKERGIQLQEYYRQQLENLPQEMQQQRLNQYKEQIEQYNTEVGQLLESYSSDLKNKSALVVEFSGQTEKEDFIKYAENQLKAVEEDGSYKTPFIHKIQNDEQYLVEMLRLSYLLENGYFTDMKNAIRKDSFENLSLFPKVGRGKTKSKEGQIGRIGGVVIEDTADPDYQKQYK